MHFSNIIQEGELDEKKVSISSKGHFKYHPNFIKKSLKKIKLKLFSLDENLSKT